MNLARAAVGQRPSNTCLATASVAALSRIPHSKAPCFAFYPAVLLQPNNMDRKDFCTELRERTQVIHDESDKLINLKLAVVLTDTELWAGVLADFYVVFRAIEEAMETHKGHPCVAPLIFQELQRRKAFEMDLEFYLGSEWEKRVQPSEPARRYCDRIWEVADQDPTLLVAYVHNMYLALLAGGQIIRRIVKRTLGLGTEGLAIFEFSEEVSKRQTKTRLKENINELDLTREQKDLIIAEKIRSFQMNNAIANNAKPTLSSFRRLIQFFILILLAILLVVAALIFFTR